jgi:glutaredoxin-related protein
VELATIRLKNMVEVLTKWEEYITNPLAIALRGATYLFDEDGKELYSYKSKGVLTYSETMARPLTFLSPYIGEDVARNPLGLKDNGGGDLVRGRGILKPAGKAMKLLSFLFKIENKLQAQALGATDADYAAARRDIEDTISNNKVVVYTYGLSPFSFETIAVLDEVGADYKQVEVGLEWFLLGKEKSVLRAELLEMTGQSSLPQVFIDGT